MVLLITGKLDSITATCDEDSHSLRFMHAALLYNAVPLTLETELSGAYIEEP